MCRTKQIYMQTHQMNTDMEVQGLSGGGGGEERETRETRETREYNRISDRRRDKIWAKNILLNTGIVILVCWILTSCVDFGPVLYVITKIFHFMESYMNFSKMVICDMISFLIGIVFIIMFILTTICFILLLCIPFLALIFAFTSI